MKELKLDKDVVKQDQKVQVGNKFYFQTFAVYEELQGVFGFYL